MLKFRFESKTENHFQPYLLSRNTIFVIGPLTIQNALLAAFVRETTGLECAAFSDFQTVRERKQWEQAPASLFLYDCVSDDFETYLSCLLREDKALFSANFLALFNVLPGTKIRNEELRRLVRGHFYPNGAPEEFTEGILKILRGDLWLSNETVSMTSPNKAGSGSLRNRVSRILSDREIQILNLVSNGEPNHSIADTLEIKDTTVQNHLSHIYKKINVQNRCQAAIWGLSNL